MTQCKHIALAILCGLILTISGLGFDSKSLVECPPPDWHSSQNWQGCSTDTECLSLERIYLREDGYSLTCIKE